jgi:hypothetical protein
MREDTFTFQYRPIFSTQRFQCRRVDVYMHDDVVDPKSLSLSYKVTDVSVRDRRL